MVKELLAATGSEKQYRQMTQIMNQNMKNGFMQGLNHSLSQKDIPEDKLKKINALAEKSVAAFQKELTNYIETTMPWNKLVNEVYAPIFMKHFTKAEMKQALEFYNSEIGKKMVNTTPTIMQEAALHVQQNYGSKINQAAMGIVQDHLGELKSKIDTICDGDC